ncbi:MAG: response regulator [Cyanobacteria bacterium P01_G01_bin.38]
MSLITPKRILLIDDEISIHVIVQISLQTEANWETLTAISGREGLAQANMEHPDAILLDMMLPDMDGDFVLNRLQANPNTREIPVILLTAQVDADTLPPASRRLSVGVIPKPFDSLTLAAQIAMLLGW